MRSYIHLRIAISRALNSLLDDREVLYMLTLEATMIHEIGNDKIRIKVKSLGAELSSLQSADGHEYLWQGSENSWTGQSPVLFPVIGGLTNNSYTWQGKRYAMASHGFARKMNWQLLESESTTDCLVFELTDNEDSRAQYPFAFRLRLTYALRDNGFFLGYTVENTGDDVLPFSIGGHPAFCCPMENGYSFTDYQLRFEAPEDTRRYLKGDLLTGETEPFRLENGVLPLDYETFSDCAIILREFASRTITLEGGSNAHSVNVDFEGFPDLGIWTHMNAKGPFICIEPWFGVDSTVGVSGDEDFATKSGMNQLPPGAIFNAGFTVGVS